MPNGDGAGWAGNSLELAKWGWAGWAGQKLAKGDWAGWLARLAGLGRNLPNETGLAGWAGWLAWAGWAGWAGQKLAKWGWGWLAGLGWLDRLIHNLEE